MHTLHLNLRKYWFDMILSGEKKEEYRELSEYWQKRIGKYSEFEISPTITFSNGYAKSRRQFVIEFKGVRKSYGLSEWGAEVGKQYFVLELGKVLTTNC